MTFAGGSYGEIERWLRNFLTSHAKRVDPRVEVLLEAGDAREGVSYGARLRLGGRVTDVVEYDYKDVAEHRGGLAWCVALAARTQDQVRSGLLGAVTTGAR